jgi:RHS repeat-associated protein
VQSVPTVLVVQENHYMPFGLGMRGLDWTLQGQKEDKYAYNGKEKQTDFDLNWSDYGARQYDPQCGCFRSVDPLAEKMASWSPYNYVFNNPIRLIDPDGNAPLDRILINAEGQVTGREVAAGKHRLFLSVEGQREEITSMIVTNSDSQETLANAQIGDVLFGDKYSSSTNETSASSVSIGLGGGRGAIIAAAVAVGVLVYEHLFRGTPSRPIDITLPEVIRTVKDRDSNLTFATYTKTNPSTGETYSGRASGFGTGREVVAARDRKKVYKDLQAIWL